MAGRPKKEFTPKEIEQMRVLARCHAPDDEIAAFLGCGESTLKRHFGPLLKEERLAGRANLRNWQFKAAEKGNVVMMIWLGKQILGQRDKSDIKHEGVEMINVTTPSGEKTSIGIKAKE